MEDAIVFASAAAALKAIAVGGQRVPAGTRCPPTAMALSAAAAEANTIASSMLSWRATARANAP